MPPNPITLKSGPDLEIVLDTKGPFRPGQEIRGYVLRRSFIVDPKTEVSIRLYGKTNVQIFVSGGMTHQVLHTCFYFFGGSQRVRKIYQGPLHIPHDSTQLHHGKWPFAIILPERPDSACLTQNQGEKKYLSVRSSESQGLPPTFSVNMNKHMGAQVEYYLEAILTPNGERNRKASKAFLPLSVQLVASSKPITDFGIKWISQAEKKIKSQRLILGTDSKLSIEQKFKKAIDSSQVPHYSFSLQVSFASVLQIGHLSTIPLQLRVNSIWGKTTEAVQNKPPAIFIEKFTLTLRSKTHYCSQTREIEDKNSRTLADYTSTKGSRIGLNTDANLASGELTVPRDDVSPPIDLGVVLGIPTPRCYPTFVTYNIKHEHHFVWELVLKIAGETVGYKGERAVKIIGPSSVS